MFANLKRASMAPTPPRTERSPVAPFSLAKTITVVVTPQELVIRPGTITPGPGHKVKQSSGRAVRLMWERDATPEILNQWKEPEARSGEGGQEVVKTEVAGVVGLLRLFDNTYLILISTSRVAGTLLTPNRTAYSVDSILSLPLSYDSARQAVLEHSQSRHKLAASNDGGADPADTDYTTSSSDHEASDPDTESDADRLRAPGAAAPPIKRSTSGLRSLGLGRYLWRARLRSRVPSTASIAPLSASTSLAETPPPPVPAASQLPGSAQISVIASEEPSSAEDVAARRSLDRKVVRELARELRGMYFALDWDVTRSMQDARKLYQATTGLQKAGKSPDKSPGQNTPQTKHGEGPEGVFPRYAETDPLWKRADLRFFWNRHLSKPFADIGADDLVFVLMQGFFQSSAVEMSLPLSDTASTPSSERAVSTAALPESQPDTQTDPPSLSLALISRRSVERSGLRYQRRGADEQGHVANFVETEFVIGTAREGRSHIGSFTQTRGSIPLYWSQSPWALKPPPVLERTPEDNADALRLHFLSHKKLYGPTTTICLAEKTGNEGKLVAAYESAVANLKDPEVQYVGWDFHKECRGMKYENISKLLELVEPNLDRMGYFWATSEGPYSTQQGTLRVNCIDCLDRTNVCQSAFARQMLRKHMVHLGLSIVPSAGMGELDMAFNELWANNGDAISWEYAGTSALKGDFVRTGKRDWRGMLNDASNSIARMWQNSIGDFFRQTLIDYVLGVNPASFAEFQESMTATDPGEILRLAKIRSVAVDTCSRLLLPDNEPRLDGWTFLSPSKANTKSGDVFEEKVLLLTSKALYVVSYEYQLQKVRDFTRILLGEVQNIHKGVYILSSIEEAARDPRENVGFLIHFRAAATKERVNTYTLSVEPSSLGPAMGSAPSTPGSGSDTDPTKGFVAFKVMRRQFAAGPDRPPGTGGETVGRTGRSFVEGVVERIHAACAEAGACKEGDPTFVKEEAIVSLAEADRATGVLTRVTQGVKHLIWL